MSTQRIATAAVPVLAAIMVMAQGAPAQPAGIPVSAHLAGAFHPATDGVTCPTEGGRVCGVRYRGDGTITGDLDGHVRFWGTLWLPADGPSYSEETFYFTGTVKDCGQGTFVYFVRPVGGEGTLDPARGGLTGQEPWQIAPGSGSTGLPGISGSGVGDWVIRPDGSFTSDYQGTISCDRPVPPVANSNAKSDNPPSSDPRPKKRCSKKSRGGKKSKRKKRRARDRRRCA